MDGDDDSQARAPSMPRQQGGCGESGSLRGCQFALWCDRFDGRITSDPRPHQVVGPCESDVERIGHVGSSMRFLVDSGATRHLVTTPPDASSVRACQVPVLFANGESKVIDKVADVELDVAGDQVTLTSALVADTAVENLMSCGRLVESGGAVFLSQQDSYMQLPTARQVSLLRKDGLFFVDMQTGSLSQKPLEQALSVKEQAIADELLTWHKRFGHPGRDQMRQALVSYEFPPRLRDAVTRGWFPHCQTCANAKATTVPYVNEAPMFRATSRNQIVYVDLMGPFPRSRQGAVYVCVFVDDFSRMTHGVGITNKFAETVWCTHSTILFESMGFQITSGVTEVRSSVQLADGWSVWANDGV